MLVGRVVGNVWATQKDASLEGVRMLLVRPFTGGAELTDGGAAKATPRPGSSDESDELVVAGDPIGAGIGETVLVAFGRAARTVLGSQDVAWQAAVVGIVDSISLAGGETFELSLEGRRLPR